MTTFELDRARARLTENPNLPGQTLAEIRRCHAEARACANIGGGFPADVDLAVALDARLRDDLGKAAALQEDRAAQLLELERLRSVWTSRFAEASALAEERVARQRAMNHEAALWPKREAGRQANAETTARVVTVALSEFRDLAGDVERALGGRGWHDEGVFIAALDQLAEGLKAVNTAIVTARRESARRATANDAERVVARVMAMAAA